MTAKLLRSGHTNVRSYRMSFFYLCIEELNDFLHDELKARSLSHRISKLDAQEYAKIMDDKHTRTASKKGKKKIVVDHEAQLKSSQGLD